MSSEAPRRSRADLNAVAEQAELRRQEGNVCFNRNRIGAAIDAYTEAITLCPDVPVYWTNRALCYLKRNDWEKVEEDCKSALRLDHNSFKAHYMMGMALLERREYAEGVKELEKALDLGRGANPNSYMVEEIWLELAKANYMKWECASSDRSGRLQRLKQACEKALEIQYLLDNSESGFTDTVKDTYREQLEYLDEVFSKAAKDDIPKEVPDYLCCRVTLEILRDPVITPSGITYERAALLEHLQKVGNFDPVTREPLEEYQLVPNLAIKEAVQAYLKDNGWAYRVDS